MLRPLLVTLGALFLSAFLLGVNPPRPPRSGVDEELLARGLKVYHALYCGTCHTFAAAHSRGQFGPSHDHLRGKIQQRLADGSYGGRAATVADYLRESILAPDAYLVPEYAGSRYRMPAFTDLSREELDVLIALLDQP